MSLKAFHIFFIILSTLLALGFGVWAVDDFGRSGSGLVLTLGVGSFIASGALMWYGAWFLRKLKHVSYL
jgi:hypothetical protein